MPLGERSHKKKSTSFIHRRPSSRLFASCRPQLGGGCNVFSSVALEAILEQFNSLKGVGTHNFCPHSPQVLGNFNAIKLEGTNNNLGLVQENRLFRLDRQSGLHKDPNDVSGWL
jgi:hypothetical protein